MSVPPERLRPLLERVLRRYDRRELLGTDPVSRVHRYRDPRDQEVVGFVAAGLAFGNVKAVLRAIDMALAPLGERPARRLAGLDRAAATRAARGFNHRWVRAADLVNLYRLLGAALREAGGLSPLFAAAMSPDLPDVRPGAAALVQGLRDLAPGDVRLERRGTRSFLPHVPGPGASKRLHMFLRWMVRSGEVDLGLWKSASPAQLIVPLDTHIARLGRLLGLTTRRTPGAAMALEITASLRRLDPADPVRYDFALSRLGILGHCPSRRDQAKCAGCDLFPVCRHE